MATVSTAAQAPYDAGAARPTATEVEPVGDILYEVVEDQVRELPPMGASEVHLASTLMRFLSHFAWERGVGHVESEMLFLLDRRTRLQRRPDLALVSFDRWPRHRPVPKTPAWDVVPNLAIEIVSPQNLANEVVQKVEEYFRAGVERVWAIYPEVLKVYDYGSPAEVRILTPEQTLGGGAVLPGWELRLGEIFGAATEAD